MRVTHTCPKCAGKKFAVSLLQQFVARGPLLPIPPVYVSIREKPGGRITKEKSLGSLNLWMCLGCGYTEMYANGLPGIEELAKQCPDQLVIVDATSKQGPHR